MFNLVLGLSSLSTKKTCKMFGSYGRNGFTLGLVFRRDLVRDRDALVLYRQYLLNRFEEQYHRSR
jgi:hypothetical protein